MIGSIVILLALGGNAHAELCDLKTDVSERRYDVPLDILSANKIIFMGFQPLITRAISSTAAAYVTVTGYSAEPSVEIGDEIVISPSTCGVEEGIDSDGSGSLTPSWFPLTCAVMTAVLSTEGRAVALGLMLASAKGAAASCTERIEVTIYAPSAVLDVARPDCQSTVVKNATSDRIVGGTFYVYDPAAAGNKTWKTVSDKTYVDLADASIKAGCAPKHKPHMVHPSPDNKHTAFTYTGDQDIVIVKNSDYSVTACPSMEYIKPQVFGGAIHQGAWHTRDYFVAVDMTGCVGGTCGGAIHKFSFTYETSGAMSDWTYVSSLGHDGVSAARGTTATKPIAVGNNPLGQYSNLFFVTDAKGAGSLLNADTMTWDTHFHKDDFGNCPGGGLWVEPHPEDEEILVVQYGTQDGSSCIFAVNLKAKNLTLLAQLSDNSDAHGIQFCKTSSNSFTVLNTNRQTSTLDVIDYPSGSFLLHDYDMNENVFDAVQASWHSEGDNRRLSEQTDKLQPDVAYYFDGFLYMAARGPKPVSAVKAQNFRENAHPGLMALKIDPATCLPDADQSAAFVLTTLERSPEITSDVHTVWGVRNGGNMEIWALDQAGTGSMQEYDVYSKCAAYGVNQDEVHDDPGPHDGD